MPREPGMPVTITIEGVEHPIRFTLGALKALHKDHGISLLKGLGDMVDPEKLALVLTAGLRVMDPAITLEWVEDHVDTASLVTMIPALAEAVSGRAPAALPNESTVTSTSSGTGLLPGQLDDTTSTLVNGRSGN